MMTKHDKERFNKRIGGEVQISADIRVNDLMTVPFAALIKADRCIISKIASYSGFAVTAFLRIKEWDIATNILNREGIFAFNSDERRFRHPVSEDNWQQAVSEERAIRCANRLIQCKG
mgnify:CR=1 FL=1